MRGLPRNGLVEPGGIFLGIFDGNPLRDGPPRWPRIDTGATGAMKALKILSYVGKLAGLVTALNVIPFVDPTVGVIVFAAASILKDTVNRVGDLLDDGKPNKRVG